MSEPRRRPLSRKLRHWIVLPIAIFATIGLVLQALDFEGTWDHLTPWPQCALAVTFAFIIVNAILDKKRDEQPGDAS